MHKYVCMKCCEEYNEPLVRCPDCGCTSFRVVGYRYEGTDLKELSEAIWE